MALPLPPRGSRRRYTSNRSTETFWFDGKGSQMATMCTRRYTGAHVYKCRRVYADIQICIDVRSCRGKCISCDTAAHLVRRARLCAYELSSTYSSFLRAFYLRLQVDDASLQRKPDRRAG